MTSPRFIHIGLWICQKAQITFIMKPPLLAVTSEFYFMRHSKIFQLVDSTYDYGGLSISWPSCVFFVVFIWLLAEMEVLLYINYIFGYKRIRAWRALKINHESFSSLERRSKIMEGTPQYTRFLAHTQWLKGNLIWGQSRGVAKLWF